MFALDRAGQERVLQLEGGDRRPAAQPGDGLRLAGHPRGYVGEPEVADLAVADEVIEYSQRFLQRREAVPVVQPQQVEVVGLQAPHRLLDLSDHGFATGVAAVGVADVQVPAELRPEHEAVPAPRGPSASRR